MQLKTFFKKKGQISTEMLILLALILVILLAVIFSALSVERPLFLAYQTTQTNQWQTSAISIETITADDTTLSLSVINRLKTSVTIDNITIDGNLLAPSSPTTLFSGNSALYTMNVSSLSRVSLVRPIISYRLADNSVTNLQVAFTQDIPVQ